MGSFEFTQNWFSKSLFIIEPCLERRRLLFGTIWQSCWLDLLLFRNSLKSKSYKKIEEIEQYFLRQTAGRPVRHNNQTTELFSSQGLPNIDLWNLIFLKSHPTFNKTCNLCNEAQYLMSCCKNIFSFKKTDILSIFQFCCHRLVAWSGFMTGNWAIFFGNSTFVAASPVASSSSSTILDGGTLQSPDRRDHISLLNDDTATGQAHTGMPNVFLVEFSEISSSPLCSRIRSHSRFVSLKCHAAIWPRQLKSSIKFCQMARLKSDFKRNGFHLEKMLKSFGTPEFSSFCLCHC